MYKLVKKSYKLVKNSQTSEKSHKLVKKGTIQCKNSETSKKSHKLLKKGQKLVKKVRNQ